MSKLPFSPTLYPVRSVTYYGGGFATINRHYVGKGKPPSGTRRAIAEISARSKKSLVWRLSMSDVNWRSMTMLTYPDKWPNHGGIVKDDLNKWLSFARNFAADYPIIVSRETFTYCWFLEWQERGAPHFHVITNLNMSSPTFFSTRGRLAYKWAEIAVQSRDKFGKPMYFDTGERMDAWIKVYRVHNHSDNWQPIRKRDGVIRYAAKYAAKSEQKDVPAGFVNPGRFWGMSRNLPMKTGETIRMDDDKLRDTLESADHPACDWEVLPKHLYGFYPEQSPDQMTFDSD